MYKVTKPAQQQEGAQQVMQQNNAPVQQKQASPYATKEGQKPVIQTKEGGKPPIQAGQCSVQRRESQNEGSDLKGMMGNQYGVDLSGYKEHKDSSFPGSVGALATIQGKDIHYAPGQFTEKNRKHELGHAIDNTMNGTPKGDTTVNGQSVDTTREAAADKIMNTPLQRKVGGGEMVQGVGGDVVQRVISWGKGNHPDGVLDKFVSTLDGLVQAASKDALDLSFVQGMGDGHMKRWVKEANAHLADEKPDFLPAAYGYAVECLAASQTHAGAALQSALPKGYTVAFQVGHGGTRPDVVVKNEKGTEVGWFDLTSAASTGHIYGKAGAGWKSKQYVAEVTYPALNPVLIGKTALSSKEKKSRLSAQRTEKKKQERFLGVKKAEFTKKWKQKTKKVSLNGERKRKLSREIMGEQIGQTDMGPTATKNRLAGMGLNPEDYGFMGSAKGKVSAASGRDTLMAEFHAE